VCSSDLALTQFIHYSIHHCYVLSYVAPFSDVPHSIHPLLHSPLSYHSTYDMFPHRPSFHASITPFVADITYHIRHMTSGILSVVPFIHDCIHHVYLSLLQVTYSNTFHYSMHPLLHSSLLYHMAYDFYDSLRHSINPLLHSSLLQDLTHDLSSRVHYYIHPLLHSPLTYHVYLSCHRWHVLTPSIIPCILYSIRHCYIVWHMTSTTVSVIPLTHYSILRGYSIWHMTSIHVHYYIHTWLQSPLSYDIDLSCHRWHVPTPSIIPYILYSIHHYHMVSHDSPSNKIFDPSFHASINPFIAVITYDT